MLVNTYIVPKINLIEERSYLTKKYYLYNLHFAVSYRETVFKTLSST